MHRQSLSFVARIVTGKLTVAIVLKDSDNPSSGECRLLEALRRDDRFETALLSAGAPPATRVPAIIAAVLAVERTGLNLLRKTPAFSCATGPVLPMEKFADLQPAPDVIVDFSGADAVETCAASVPFGMWRLDAYNDAAGLDAAFLGKGATPVSLLRYPGNGQMPETLARVVYDTKALAAMNVMYIQEKSVQLIEHELARLMIDPAQTGQATVDPPPAMPGTTALCRYLYLAVADICARSFRAMKSRMGLRPRMFTLRVGRGDFPDFNPAASVEIMPPGNRYWADPFLFEDNGEVFLFFEDFDYGTGRGHISVGRLDGTDFELIGTAHSAPHHLSYPYVFRHGDDIFMMPETHQAGRIEIWRATDFPTGWELYSTAMEGAGAVDCVLKEIDGTWWLFANICRDSFNGHCSELHVFRTDGPALTRIEPHRLNPVVIGADTARGGGRVFDRDGRWYRCSQDNSGGVYGYALNIMEIETLDIDHYRERRVRHITPDFAQDFAKDSNLRLIGCHHVDATQGLFVIDTRKP